MELVKAQVDSLIATKWLMTMNINLHPRADGKVRVVTVKTSKRIYRCHLTRPNFSLLKICMNITKVHLVSQDVGGGDNHHSLNYYYMYIRTIYISCLIDWIIE